MKFICFDEIDSTNVYLKNNYQKLDDLSLVSAKNQTQGKGRKSRVWYSDKNNLLCSLLLKNKNYYSYYKEISIISAYSILKVLEEYGLNNLNIKWPNDIYYNNSKICGILLESVSRNDIECLIIGIGLNVNQIIFDKEYLTNPTSMKLVLNKDINISELKVKVYERIVDNLNKLVEGYDFYDEICKYDYLKNKSAYAIIDNHKRLVKIIGINKNYSLKVELNDSQLDIESDEISFHI